VELQQVVPRTDKVLLSLVQRQPVFSYRIIVH
jgi:hypothetical protein